MGLRPDFGLAANNLAYLLLQDAENIDQAITYAEIARRQLPNAPAVADTLGWAYYQKGTTGLAITMLLDAVKGMPNSATYHYHLGLAYSKSGDRQRAKTELQRAMQLELVDSNKDKIRKSLAALG
jgi:tetratricopeptide (TPR) repeat protein